MQDNFQFDLKTDIKGYISSKDKTLVNENYIVHGSQNVYKKISGTIATRPGIKQYGPTDSTTAGVVSNFPWQTTTGKSLELRVSNNKLQVLSNITGSLVWYDLLEQTTLLNPARSLTNFSFDKWYETLESKDRLAMVRGDANILHWSGGISIVGSTSAAVSGIIDAFSAVTPSTAGTGYAIGDVLTITGGDGTATCRVDDVSAFPTLGVTAVTMLTYGTGYTTGNKATTGGAGSGCFISILNVVSAGTITKQVTSTSWSEDGFSSYSQAENTVVIGGVQYSYGYSDSTNLFQVTPDPVSIPAGSIAIQPVIVGSGPTTSGKNDFIKTLNNQLMVGSLTSRIIYISSDTSPTGPYELGMTDFVNVGALVSGDPDFAALDENPTGMAEKDGKMFVSGSLGNWYVITPNVPLPVSVTISGSAHFVYTRVEKLPGAGNTGAYSHDFIVNAGGDIIYLAKDQQVRTVAYVANILDKVRFPSLSLEVADEFSNETFTGGHARAIGEFIYFTAPTTGRHWMRQTRQTVGIDGAITQEIIWHPPQVAGISRFTIADGVTYGHSNQNPMMYQIWDTGQWHDDSPSGNLPYTCILRLAYSHLKGKAMVDRVATGRFDKAYFEGYMTEGTNLYGNVYFDYQGASGVQNVVINSVANPATFYSAQNPVSLGQAPLGDNPLGDGLVPDSNEQEQVPKFRVICDINPVDSFEHSLELYSNDEDARWEILSLGTNLQKSPTQPVEIRKSS